MVNNCLTFPIFFSNVYTVGNNGRYYSVCVKSAFKHGYTQEDIERAIETKIYEDTLKGEDDIYVIIGFDTLANPIEIFYNIIDDETIKIFHVMELREKIASQMNEEV